MTSPSTTTTTSIAIPMLTVGTASTMTFPGGVVAIGPTTAFLIVAVETVRTMIFLIAAAEIVTRAAAVRGDITVRAPGAAAVADPRGCPRAGVAASAAEAAAVAADGAVRGI